MQIWNRCGAADEGIWYIDRVLFGSLGGEPLQWVALKTDANKEAHAGRGCVLLVSDRVVAKRPWSSSGCSYEDSEIRAYLEEEFYYDAFTTAERSQIIMGMPLLLSADDALDLFASDRDRLAWPTAHAAASEGLPCSAHGTVSWWLSTPSGVADYIKLVRPDGGLFEPGLPPEGELGVRPAIWVDPIQIDIGKLDKPEENLLWESSCADEEPAILPIVDPDGPSLRISAGDPLFAQAERLAESIRYIARSSVTGQDEKGLRFSTLLNGWLYTSVDSADARRTKLEACNDERKTVWDCFETSSGISIAAHLPGRWSAWMIDREICIPPGL